MKNKYKWFNNKKDGFIQIPILIVIFSVLLASGGAGAVLYKQGKLPFNSKTEVMEQIENSENGNSQEPSPTSLTIEASPVIKPVVVPLPTVLPSPSPVRKTVSVGFSEIESGKLYICYEDKVGEMVAANEQLKTAKQASEKYKSCVAEKTPTDEEKIACAKNCSKQYGGVYNEGCIKSCQGDFSGCGSEGGLFKMLEYEGILKFLIKDNCQHD